MFYESCCKYKSSLGKIVSNFLKALKWLKGLIINADMKQVNGEKREVFGDALDAGEVTECLSLSCLSGPCLNGGSCSDHHDNGYTCSCANG